VSVDSEWSVRDRCTPSPGVEQVVLLIDNHYSDLKEVVAAYVDLLAVPPNVQQITAWEWKLVDGALVRRGGVKLFAQVRKDALRAKRGRT
jgi:hypothetical protein